MIRSLSLALFAALVFAVTVVAQDIPATTNDGRRVILRDNGTWVFDTSSPCGNYFRVDEKGERIGLGFFETVGGLKFLMMTQSGLQVVAIYSTAGECLAENSDVFIQFTDESMEVATNEAKTNCKGNATMYFGELKEENVDMLTGLKTKLVEGVVFEDMNNKKVAFLVTEEEAIELRERIRCLTELSK